MADQEKQENVAAEQSAAQANPVAQLAAADDANRSLRTVVIFSSVVLWVMAIFIINSLYSVNDKMDQMIQYIQATMSVASHRPLDSYEVVDKDGNIQFKFRLDPNIMKMEMGQGEMGAGCPMDEGMMGDAVAPPK